MTREQIEKVLKREFGEDLVKDHPEIVAAIYMSRKNREEIGESMRDFHASIIINAREHNEEIRNKLDSIEETLNGIATDIEEMNS